MALACERRPSAGGVGEAACRGRRGGGLVLPHIWLTFQVAVKIAHRFDPATVARFEREADALRAIGAPVVPELVGAGRLEDGRPYLVLERVEAPTPAARLAELDAPPPQAWTCHIASAILSGLAVAPARGFGSSPPALSSHPWPGNVRELRNYVERCIAMRTQVPPPAAAEGQSTLGDQVDFRRPFRDERDRWLAIIERSYVEQILAQHDGNLSAAARAAGMDRPSFYRLLWRHGLK